MQSKRDQLQAHNFMVGRLRSALLRADADAPQTPTRRFSVSAFAGILVAALLVAGAGVFGLVFPGGDRTWRAPGTIIVERETGNRYLFVDGALRPVLNLPSARLLAGDSARVKLVSAASLRGVRHGLPVGIPGAPADLPAPGALLTSPWLVCATDISTGSAGSRPGVSVLVGATAGDVRPLGDRAVPLTTSDGGLQLLWQDRRMLVPDPSAIVAFGYRSAPTLRVSARWLNAVPQGRDLTAPSVPDRGRPGPVVGGRPTRVGQVLVVETTTGVKEYYLVMTDGLAAVPPAAAGLLLASPDSRAAYDPEPVGAVNTTPDSIVRAPQAKQVDWADRPGTAPPTVAPLADRGEELCAQLTFDTRGRPTVTVVLARPPATPGAVAPSVRTGATADAVSVPAGRGLLVRSQSRPDGPGGTMYLVTDLGVKFPVPSAKVARTLGYGNAQPVTVPAGILSFLPSGPALDPTAAGRAFVG